MVISFGLDTSMIANASVIILQTEKTMGLDVTIIIHGNVTKEQIEGANKEIRRFIPKTEGPYPSSRDYDNVFRTIQEDESYFGGNVIFATLWRYWGPGYERGPWPAIHAVLLIAQSYFRDATAIAYGSDCDEKPLALWTKEREKEYHEHYCGLHRDDYWKG